MYSICNVYNLGPGERRKRSKELEYWLLWRVKSLDGAKVRQCEHEREDGSLEIWVKFHTAIL